MMNEEFSDESDSDDVDFDPNQDIGNNETDEDDSSEEAKSEFKQRESNGKGKAKRRKTQKKHKAGINEDNQGIDEGGVQSVKPGNVTDVHDAQEKLAEDEAKEKARTDRLWADFLSSVESEKKRKSSTYSEETKMVTKVYNFAGQRIEVEEEVKVTSLNKESSQPVEKTENNTEGTVDAAQGEVKTTLEAQKDSRDRSHIPKRKRFCFLSSNPDEIGLGADSKGLKSVVNAIFAKNKKVNTLYKTKVDWKKFKQENNMDAELKLHRNSKNGYVDKQEFLQRTDLREFERERDLRANARRKNQNQR